MEARHDSVLMDEVLAALALSPQSVVVDATVGGAGHFKRILHVLESEGVLVGIDADSEALDRARTVVDEDRRAERPLVHLVNDNFRNLARIVDRLQIDSPTAILFDLGWSGYQVAAPRGFSFQKDEPLLMVYGGAEQGETAADIVNHSSEQTLADLLYTYGEERFSRSIARAIVAHRAKARILTTFALVDAVRAGTPAWYHDRKIHPATKTFQALRIAVNDELTVLREGLAAALSTLADRGRLAVISFHSIEDRIVKTALRTAAHEGQGVIVTKKPIIATREEVLANRRARSAKLRVFERTRAHDEMKSQVSSPELMYV